MGRVFIILALSFIIGYKCLGQDIRFTVMTSHDGLLSNTVNAITKDHYGFLWFATADGLDRFDGMTHKAYRFDPADKSGYRSKEVTSIYEDDAGQFWVATLGGGLYFFDRSHDQFRIYPESSAHGYLANSFIKTIYGDKSGRLWIGMMGGLCVLDPKTKKEIFYKGDEQRPGQLPLSMILSIFRDSQQRMWIGTGKGLYLFDEGSNSFIAFRHKNNDPASIPDDGVNTIAEYQHKLWIGTNNGLSVLSPDLKTFRSFKYNPNDDSTLSGNLIYSIAANGNNIWVGTEGGLDVLDPISGKVKRYNHDERNKFSVSSKSIRCIYNDPEGIYWLGTYQGGVDKYDKNLTLFNSKKNNAYDPAGLNAPFVSSFAENKDGDIFVGTDGGGLSLFHLKSGLFSHIEIKAKEKTNSAGLPILSMMLDRNQQLWIGTFQNGLFIYNTKTGQYEQLNAGKDNAHINNNEIFCIKEDRKGKIWIGTNGGGVNMFDPVTKTFLKYVSTPSSPGDRQLPVNGFIRAIEEDHEGNIWIGTYGSGVAVLDPTTQKFRVYNDKNTGMAIDRAFSILEDRSGNVWIGTGGDGLFRFNPNQDKTFASYAAPGDLPDGVIHKLLEDNSGNIWLTTDKGICTFNAATKKFTHYCAYNGLQNDAFIDGSGLRSSKGILFFGGNEGFNYIDPSHEVKRNDNIPPVFLTNLKVNNTVVLAGNNSALKQDISVAKQIDLDYKQNFSIGYSAINFTLPQQNKYAYMLKPFNKNWNYVGSTTTAYYTNLDPGEYVFLVRARNNDGVWNNSGTQIRIVIHPPIWMTWYAYLSYALIVAGVLLLIRHQGIKKLKAKLALEQERREAERLHELDMLKIKFLTNLSHEFRTPISLIMAPTDKLLAEHEDEQTTGQLAVIRRNARRLLNLVNQLLDFRKLEEEELKLNLREGEINSFIRDVVDSFRDLSESRGIALNINAPSEKLFVRFDHDKIERILFNILSNAFKFTLPGGTVSVDISAYPMSRNDKTMLEFKISDTGIGIEPDKRYLIFERFYQGNHNIGKVNPGSGIGLSITKEFVEMHDGTINVESEIGKGSVFSILIPLEIFADSSIVDQVPVKTPVKENDIRPKTNNNQVVTDVPVLLIVEDNDEFRYYIKDNLKTQYKIVEASNGAEGWDKALSCHPDLIISDITMPNMDGITLSKKIKADKRTSHIPFIMLTARTREDEQLKGLESGANDYLTKPFNFEILNIKIKNLLQLNIMLKNTYTRQLKVVHPDIEVESGREKFLGKVINYINNNLNNPKFSVVDLSEHLAMSRGALYTKIFELTGLPPVEFIRSYKLDRAAILLLKSDLSVSQIAYEAGFATPHYFSRSFKDKFNMLPSEYRKMERNSVVA